MANAALTERIRTVHARSRGTYGSPRVHAELREAGPVGRKRVARLMREAGLAGCRPRGFRRTTIADPTAQADDLVKRDFRPADLDRLWVADITYVRLPAAFAYLACVLDAWSRRCVGWFLARSIDARLTPQALDRALATRCPAPGLIHHSDRAVQYASDAYVTRLEGIGARLSMAGVGNPYENAKAESFFKTLKGEEVSLQEYRTFAEAEASIGRFIDDVYNAMRLHSSLGYRPPIEFKAAHLLAGKD